MKSVRIWFKKIDTAKYISHLDVCRCMERAIHKAKLPFRYTEGYNPHVFLTITMPISLGFTGLRESMDVKITDDDMPYSEIIEKLNSGLPLDIVVYEITEQKMKPGDVEYSAYQVLLENDDNRKTEENIKLLLSEKAINVKKRSKKGEKIIDIKPYFENITISYLENGRLILEMILPNGNLGSINPKLLFDGYFEKFEEVLFPQIVRTTCLNKYFEPFV